MLQVWGLAEAYSFLRENENFAILGTGLRYFAIAPNGFVVLPL